MATSFSVISETTAPTADPQGSKPSETAPVTLNQVHKRTELSRIADSLEDEYQIGFHRDKPRVYRRYVLLRSREIFNRLVDLYSRQFNASWHALRRTVEAFDFANYPFPDAIQNAAVCYISSWIWDLYVTNRKCVEKISSTAFTQYFHTQQSFTFAEFDPFLTHLNSVIRPTHIINGLEDTLYIPLISETIDFTSESPFGIPNYRRNDDLVQALLQIFQQKNNNWRTEQFTDNTTGRPMWLFDWRLNQAYAWFPNEGNFSRDDTIAAYILGIPCSPRLGPRDIDDWQIFPGGNLPNDLTRVRFDRLTARRFYGSAEYRTISIDDAYILPNVVTDTIRPPAKRKQTEQTTGTTSSQPNLNEPSDSMQVSTVATTQAVQVARFQIIDWTYNTRVIMTLNQQKINQSFRTFLFG